MDIVKRYENLQLTSVQCDARAFLQMQTLLEPYGFPPLANISGLLLVRLLVIIDLVSVVDASFDSTNMFTPIVKEYVEGRNYKFSDTTLNVISEALKQELDSWLAMYE